MKQDKRQLDSFGIPVWISNFCNQHQTLHLSDTRTYRLLMVIYRAIIDMGLATKTPGANREEILSDFMTWFLGLGNSMPAYLGLMWVHQGIGEKIMAIKNAEPIGDDERLARLQTAFIVLSDEAGDDPASKRYWEMIGKGWSIRGQDEHKESLYCGFVATFLAHSCYELVALGEKHGSSEAKTKKALLSSAAYMAEHGR